MRKKIGNREYKSPDVQKTAVRVEEFEIHEMLRKKKEDKGKRKRWWIIDPRSSAFTKYWDIITSGALVFTAIFTPVEVGFISLPEDRWADPLFLTNRGIDLIFVCDMALQFFIMYVTTDVNSPEGERWVRDQRKIARRYLTSWWFCIDTLSIAVSGFDMAAPTTGPISRFKGFRAIRVLRLIKLVRLVSASRIFKRWEMRMSINYAKLSIVQILVGFVFICHLFGCLWGLQSSFDPLNTWPGQKNYCIPWDPCPSGVFVGDLCAAPPPCPADRACSVEGYACYPPVEMYLYSVYWAIATVTSIGYGDVAATSTNQAEQLVCTILMIVGAIVFAQIVGSFCGLAAALSPEKAQFRFDLSDLNYHMSEEDIPAELRYRLREYMHQTVHLRQGKIRVRLLELLSPGLAGEFALKMNDKWLRDLWFLQGLEHHFDLNVELALALRAKVFPHQEVATTGSLYIVTKGRALYGGHVLKVGQTWGSDEVLEQAGLRASFPAIALAYLWTYAIEGSELRRILNRYPDAAELVKRHQIKLVRRRAMVRAAEEECMREEKPFHGRNRLLYARSPAKGARSLGSNLQHHAILDANKEGPTLDSPPPFSAPPSLDQLTRAIARLTELQLQQQREMHSLAVAMKEVRSDVSKLLTNSLTA